MIRIALTEGAYDTIASTLPKGSARWPMQRDRGQCFIQVEAAVVDRMRGMRRAGESYSDVILRLVETGGEGRRVMARLHHAREATETAVGWRSPLAGSRGRSRRREASPQPSVDRQDDARHGRGLIYAGERSRLFVVIGLIGRIV